MLAWVGAASDTAGIAERSRRGVRETAATILDNKRPSSVEAVTLDTAALSFSAAHAFRPSRKLESLCVDALIFSLND